MTRSRVDVDYGIVTVPAKYERLPEKTRRRSQLEAKVAVTINVGLVADRRPDLGHRRKR